VISKDEMMDGMLQACPSFRPDWDAFLEEWRSDADKPLYLALGALARHLIAMLATEDTAGLVAAFEAVERWHLEGDAFVREAATVGLLEDLQNDGLHQSTSPADLERFLLPESLKWWRKVDRFWRNGELVMDD
jgi:hypothetical protein